MISGAGSISQSGNTTTIDQSSQSLSINWQSFNIAAQQTVDFVQPSASAIAVNHILGNNGSQILGHLDANGQVYLINPNGILFGAGAQVNVGGLVASTLDVSDATVNGGTRNFVGSGTGSVVNQGTINAANGGYVTLLGNHVSNQGVISAQLGTVALGAGNSVTLTFSGNSLVHLQVDQSVLKSLAENGGLIRANGGQVLMTAGAKDALLASVVNNTGAIEARTVENHEGTITLLGGGTASTVNVGGTLDASAPAGGNGGRIETSAAHVEVADDAKVTTASTKGLYGSWLIDPNDFEVAPSGGDITGATLSSELGTTSVTLQSSAGATAGSGNINVNDAVSWSANTALTLTASNNVNINSNITATGNAASLLINPNTANGSETPSGTGTLNIGAGASVTLSGANAALSIATPTYNLGTGATIDLPNVSPTSTTALVISGTPYSVINSLGSPGSTTGTDLQGISGNLSGHYALGSNINDTFGFAPIGSSATPFTGTFDGLGHTISDLTISLTSSTDVGLFGYTGSSAGIRNVGLIGGSVSADGVVGGLVGDNNGTISNSYNTGNVTGNLSVGGLVGINDSSVSNSYATGTVKGAIAGGLIGDNNGGATVANSHATGAVNGTDNEVGGLAGLNYGTITGSYATGNVNGNQFIGGLVGENNGAVANSVGVVANSYATGNVTGALQVGGLVGINDGSVTNSYYTTGTVAGAIMGGLIGQNNGGCTVSNSYATATVSGTGNDIGGLVGVNYGSITNTYATGPVNGNGNAYTGGLVGINHGPISDSYATGHVIGLVAGGLAGSNTASISNSYATGNIAGLDNENGGLVGLNYGTLTKTYATGNVNGNLYTGGLVGLNHGPITDSYATGNVGGGILGGLVGFNDSSISTSYATGNVAGLDNQNGGLVGANYGPITNTYATGSVNGNIQTGGLVGLNFNTITNSYSTGRVTGNGLGLVGANGGVISNSFWDVTTSGQSNSAGGTGLTTAQLSGALPTGFDPTVWGNVNNQTTPYLLSNPGPIYIGSDSTHLFSLVFSLSQLQAINNDLAGDFALATSLNASGTTNWVPLGTDGAGNVINSGSGFSGIFDGLGNTISNLTLNLPSVNYVGLFGYSGTGSVIQNVGLMGGSVSGFAYVGGLAGYNAGTVSNSYAMGSVSGASGSNQLGGLVGANFGTISNSYATGSVSGGANSSTIGGLVGENDGTVSTSYATGNVSGAARLGGLLGENDGTVSNSYATGSMSTGVNSQDIGGLVGINSGTVSTSYATGNVNGASGSNQLGGLVGANFGTISNGYAAGGVSGSSYVGGLVGYNAGPVSGAALTTAQLSGALPTGFDPTVWGNVNNQTTPYLLSNPGPVYIGSDSTHPFSLVFSLSQLQAINNDLAGDFALATSLNASGTTNWVPLGTDGAGNVINSGSGFSGIFDGLGNTISNLTINLPSANSVGLFGYSSGTIRNIGMVGGSVNGGVWVGGLVGENGGGTVSNSYATGSVSGTNAVGGLVGWNHGGGLSNSYATGNVIGSSGSYYVGGLVGSDDGTPSTISTISNSYATGNVSGGNGVGGLVGLNGYGSVSNSYATGSVSGTNDVGGLVGYSSTAIATVIDSYAAGNVSRTGNTGAIGGLVGGGAGTASNSFWDVTTSAQSTSAGGIGLTTAQMQAASSFTGWSIANTGGSGGVWRIYEGHTYPLLISFLTPLTLTDAPDTTLTYNGSTQSGPTTAISGVLGAAAAGTNAGFYNGYYSSQQGYDITGGNLTINPASLTLNGTRVYDGTTIVGGGVLTAYGVAGQTFSVTGAGDPSNLASKNVQTDSTLATVAGLMLGTSSDGGLVSNYLPLSTTGSSITISPLALTATIASSSSVYGSALNPGVVTLNGVVAGDVVNPGSATVNTSTLSTSGHPIVGSYTQSVGSTLSGGDAGDYTFAGFTTPAPNYAISPLALTASIATGTSVYGSPLNPGAVTLNGAISGDLVNPGAVIVNTAGHTSKSGYLNASSYIGIESVGTALTGTDAGNYTFAGATGNYTVSPAPLTVTGLSGTNQTYTGTAVDPLTGTPLLHGLIGSETVTVGNDTNGTMASANAGSEPITTTLTIANGTNGGLASNYTLIQPTLPNVTIAQLASATWVGGTSGNWSKASNWENTATGVTGTIPDYANVAAVIIPAGDTVTYNSAVPGSITVLTALQNSGNLTVTGGSLSVTGTGTTNGGSFSMSGGNLSVSGNFSSTAGFAQSGGALDVGGSLTAASTKAVTLGNITAASLRVSSTGGAITQGGGTAIDVTGTSSLTAGSGDTIALASANNNFVGAVSASGANVSLTDSGTSGLMLGNITTSGTLTLTSTAGPITEPGYVTLNVTGATALTADNGVSGAGDLKFNVLLPGNNNNSNSFGGNVSANGAIVYLDGTVAGSTLTLGNITATGMLTVSNQGPIAQGAGTISVTGPTYLHAFGNIPYSIALTNKGNSFVGAVTIDDAATVSLLDGAPSGLTIDYTGGNLTLGNTTATGSLSVSANGSITQSLGSAISAGATSLSAPSANITLGNATNSFGGAVNSYGSNIDLADGSGGLTLGSTTATGTLTATSSGPITEAVSTTLNVTGVTTLSTPKSITLANTNVTNDFGGKVTSSGSSIDLESSGGLILGATAAGAGGLTVASNGPLTQSGAVNVTGSGTTSLNTNNNNITLTNPSNSFAGAVSSAGSNIDLVAGTGGLILGNTTAPGTFIADSLAGAITQVAGTALNVGTTNLTANKAITLANANSFVGTVTATGTAITLDDAAPLTAVLDSTSTSAVTSVGALNVSGTVGTSLTTTTTANGSATNFGPTTVGTTLVASSAGPITQSLSTALGVTAATTLTAPGYGITLTNAKNSFGGAVTASGQNINLLDDASSGLKVGNTTATGTLMLTAAAGPISQTASTTINATGPLTLDAQGGAITQGSGAAIDASGSSSLTARNGSTYYSVTLGNTGNDFVGTVTATGGAIALTDATALTAALDSTAGNASLTAAGSMNVSGTIAGNLTTDTTGTGSATTFGNTTIGKSGGTSTLTVTSTGAVTTATGDVLTVDGAGTTTSNSHVTVNGTKGAVIP